MKFSSFNLKNGRQEILCSLELPLIKSGVINIVVYLLILFSFVQIVSATDTGTIKGKVSCARVRHSGDTVVYTGKADGTFTPPAQHAVVDQQNLVFIPHVLPILAGTSVDFPNSDQVRHNVFSPPGSPNPFNLGTYDIGVTKTVSFPNLGEVPLLCNVHAEMSAFIVVLENPYFAVTDKTGVYTIENVPPGKYTLTTWHEKLKPESQEVTVEEGKIVEVNLELKKKR